MRECSHISGKPGRGRNSGILVESLECRRLLSTINWVNRGVINNDTDGFGSVFGASAETARNVVAAALRHWARVISNFNYFNGTNTYQMTVNMAAGGTSAGANAGPTAFIGNKPSAGSMTIGRGGDAGSDGIGDGVGYYLDPNPDDAFEFGALPISTAGTTANAFAGYAGTGSPARNLGDLYELALHELGHAMGIGSGTQMNAFATDTGTGDTQSSAPAVANLWLFNGPSVTTLMTGYDSGGQSGGASNAAGAQHFAFAASSAVVNGITYVGADDLMNPTYSNSQRRLISNADALMLKDAYGYTIEMPETFGTFYANLNRANGYLYVSGGANNSSDTITVNAVGSDIVVRGLTHNLGR